MSKLGAEAQTSVSPHMWPGIVKTRASWTWYWLVCTCYELNWGARMLPFGSMWAISLLGMHACT